ncbi:MAG: hypothetical protein Kow0091_31520 [Geminocystis sp.]
MQFYGTQQHRINLAIQTLEKLPAVYNHPQGKQIVRLLAMFPDGLSEDMRESLGMNKSLILSIAGTNQVDFNLKLNNGFANRHLQKFINVLP